MLKAALIPLRAHGGSVTEKTDDEFWDKAQTEGGWRGAPVTPDSRSAAVKSAQMALREPEFAGSAAEFPFYFQPYVTPAFGDGSAAHLPWMQELPDVLTTAMWSSWVEINSETGRKFGIQQGDLVEVTSPAGSLLVPVVLSPGIAPDVLAMPVGQGHENFGRFASKRGANPLSILAPIVESNTGSLAWAATRVKVARVGGPEQAKLVLFAGGMSGFPHEEESR
jgi:anaerobic selenocysteine-containing dehydrogenase